MTHYTKDYELSPASLGAKYERRGQHPGYPLDDWRFSVTQGDTLRGYWLWVAGQLEQERDELERDSPYQA